MSAMSVEVPYPVFTNRDGEPIDNGYVWVGVANLQPQTNPIQVYFDRDLTQLAAQPLRTINGYVSNAGTPSQIYIDGSNFSILVQDKNGTTVYSFADGTGIEPIPNNACGLAYTPNFTGAVTRPTCEKLEESVSVKDFGAIGNGVADDTGAIENALTASKHVIVPSGMTCLISSTITVPENTRLEFLGGTGNLRSNMPASYFIKKSTMTTPGIIIQSTGIVTGGGLLCQLGNTGDGVQLNGNAAMLSEFIVVGAGRDGVRVGTDGVFANCNSVIVEYVKARENGRHGIYVHDGVSIGPSDANIATLLKCTSIDNTQDGIRIGHAFWTTIINCLTEINGGWGLYLSGNNNDSYPECRWTTVLGGDFNEGNTTGQAFDASYFATFVQPDGGSVPNTAPNGLQGSAQRSVVSASVSSSLQGLLVNTYASGPATKPLIVDAGYAGGNLYPSIIRQTTTSTNNDGPGLKFQVKPSLSGTYRDAGSIRVNQRSTNYENMTFAININGVLTDMFSINGFTGEVFLAPSTDNTTSLGRSALRWSVVYAATGAINTSDGNQKQDIKDLSVKELAVAKSIKGLIKSFKFKDAVKEKGANARIHIGVIAQDVKAAFESKGLVAEEYGIFCSDTWVDDTGVEHTRLGIRYDELLAFVIGAM